MRCRLQRPPERGERQRLHGHDDLRGRRRIRWRPEITRECYGSRCGRQPEDCCPHGGSSV